MIIYGQKSKELAHQTLFENCPNCGASNCVELFVLQNYAHVFWIPSFPVGKTGVSQCSNCKKVLKLKEMPADFKSAYQNLKSQTKTPIWTFIGIGAFGVFLFAIWVIGNQEKEKYAAILQTPPQVGDIYEISTKGKNYTLYKVTAVEKDSISVRFTA